MPKIFRGGRLFLYKLVPTIVILICWEIVSEQGFISQAFFPPVSTIIVRLYSLFTPETANTPFYIPANVILTFERMLLGYFLAIVVAVSLGLAIGTSKRAYRLLSPTLEFFRPLPTVVLIPIFIILLGINEEMYVAFVAYGSAWPILLNTIDGVRNIDPMLFDVARSIGISRRKTFAKITLPAASPYIVSGLRVSLLLSLLLAIVIEMINGHNGLGYSALFAQYVSQVKTLYAEIFFIAALGFVINLGVVRLENRFMSWHKRSSLSEFA